MFDYQSYYLTMRDGVRLAADVWLPHSQHRPAATILRQTRYFRSIQLRPPLNWLTRNRPIDHSGLYAKRRRRFLEAGYAWVDVDVRGSGASFGHRISPWSQAEVADGYEIVEWIGSQSWSNGSLGSLGISYDGTAAEMLLTTGHPALKAIAPRFSSCDSFADIGFPGGLLNRGFVERWSRLNAALDANRLHEIAGGWVRLLTSGVTAVASDRDRRLLMEAISQHRVNDDVWERVRQISFADDEPEEATSEIQNAAGENGEVLRGSQLISPVHYSNRIASTSIPVFGVSGWWDGAYARAAALRFVRIPNPGSRLLLGPWNHGGARHIEPMKRSRVNYFDHDRLLLQFFDLHVRGRSNALAEQPPVQYFTMGESRWKSSQQWPPTGTCVASLFLNSGGRLESGPDATQCHSRYERQPTTTGKRNRWQTQVEINGKVQYPDRRAAGRSMLCFRSPRLASDIEVTGHPVVNLHIKTDVADAALFVYLEDVDPRGRVWMVTEGGLSLLHQSETQSDGSMQSEACRKLGTPYRRFTRNEAGPNSSSVDTDHTHAQKKQHVCFDLQPTSYLFRRGSQIQLSIAMADENNFENRPGRQLHLFHGSVSPSRIDLPVCNPLRF